MKSLSYAENSSETFLVILKQCDVTPVKCNFEIVDLLVR